MYKLASSNSNSHLNANGPLGKE